ncbi:hypothetical protein A6V39_00365 [Candidatus Mycoplasma haematobovis]|uniref:DUF31 domain-containing protein n=1 Tax=Candidatus Mycoplasma haematobovis TaxID=432608 RepID=A0A1A9QDG1_9MOLU|nr:hypothetical protein [Candidatus Mycoplasma haematobovis]OAL10503.1 hypothetical protein A6V39_00365 [Candidatus Mycoplasma haematobovis]
MNISQQAWGAKEKDDYGAVATGKMKEPRLFYAAFNYLEKREINYDHFLDLAVLELEFNSEESERKATGGFANKYTLKSNNAINLFNKPLEAKYSKEELDNLTENFYHLAYPYKKGDKWNYSTNFDEPNAIAGSISRQIIRLMR